MTARERIVPRSEPRDLASGAKASFAGVRLGVEVNSLVSASRDYEHCLLAVRGLSVGKA